MAILLQALAVRLGIGSGRDLAQACRDSYSKPVTIVLVDALRDRDRRLRSGRGDRRGHRAQPALRPAADLGRVPHRARRADRSCSCRTRGSATSRRWSWRSSSRSPPASRSRSGWRGPTPADVAAGFIPRTEILTDPAMLYIALGILGATVMPHNLYLHSSIVQTRRYVDTYASKAEAIRFATIDSSIALMSALFINAAILIVSAAVFHGTEHDVGGRHRRRLPAAVAAAGHGGGQHALRRRAAVLRAERDAHRHAGRADRDGRLRQHPAAALAAPADHAARGHRAGGDRRDPRTESRAPGRCSS